MHNQTNNLSTQICPSSIFPQDLWLRRRLRRGIIEALWALWSSGGCDILSRLAAAVIRSFRGKV